MVELMSMAEQVDGEFAVARRKALLRGLRRWLVGAADAGKLLPFEQTRRNVGAYGGFRRGRSTVEVSRIVGSAGKHDQFDDAFIAYRTGVDLPPVSLYSPDGDFFVQDGHHRVGVVRFHGAEWLDAEVTEFRSSGRKPRQQSCNARAERRASVSRRMFAGPILQGFRTVSLAVQTLLVKVYERRKDRRAVT